MSEKNFSIKIFLGLLLWLSLAEAQLPSYQSHRWNINLLHRLIELEKYNTAKHLAEQKSFFYENFTEHYPTLSLNFLEESYFSFLEGASAYNLLNNDAENLLQNFSEKFPEDSKKNRNDFHLAKLLFLKKKYDKTEEIIQNISEENLTSEEVQDLEFIKGYLAFRKKRYQEAVAHLLPLTEKLGKYHHPASYYTGISLYNLGKYSQALEHFRTIEKIEPYSRKVPVFIASILLNTKDYKNLVAYGEELLQSSREIEQKDKIYLFIGNALFQQKKYKQALKYLQEYFKITRSPESAAIYRIAYIYLQQKKYPQAKKYFEKIAHQENTLGQAASYYLGFVYFALKDYENSRLAFRSAYTMPFHKEFEKDALIQYARVSFHAQYFPEALAAFQEFLKKYPDDKRAKDVKTLLAEAYYYAGQYKNAINFLQKRSRLSEKEKVIFQKASLFQGLNFLEKAQYDSALYYFKTGLSEISRNKKLNLSLQFWYSETLFWKKDYQGASLSYATFLQVPEAKNHKYFFPALIGAGWSYLKQKVYSVAFAKFSQTDKYLELQNKYPLWHLESLIRRGDIRFLQKKYVDAALWYKRALAQNLMHQDYILFQLGRTYKRLSNYPKAAKYFEQLVTEYTTSAFREEALYLLGDLYLVWIKDYPKVEKYAQILVKDYPKGKYAAEGYLLIAGAAYSSKDNLKAEKYFKHVIYEFGEDSGAVKAAFEGLVNILPPEEFDRIYEQYRQKYPVKNLMLEDLTFETARERYNAGKLQKAIEKLSQYIREFPAGKYANEARFLRANAYLETKDTASAVLDFSYLTDSLSEWNSFTPGAARKLANIYLLQKQNAKAKKLLLKIDSLSSDPYEKLHAEFNIAELYVAEQNYDSAEVFLKKVLQSPSLTEYSRNRASLNLAKITLYQGDTASALRKFQELADKNKNVFGAQAQYFLAKIYYDLDSLDKAKQIILAFKKKFPSYNYWKAKAFIIMGDIYLEKGRKLQARETWKSIAKLMKKYPDIIAEVQEKLEKLQADENKEE